MKTTSILITAILIIIGIFVISGIFLYNNYFENKQGTYNLYSYSHDNKTVYGKVLRQLDLDGINVVKDYDENAKEVTFKGTILGIPSTTLAKAKLDTPLVYYVMPGKNRKVGEFTIDLSQDGYLDALKEIKLYDKNKDMKSIDRKIVYKYKTFYDVEVNDYEYVCTPTGETDKNGTKIEDCKTEVVGKHTEQRESWTPIEKLDLAKGKITIGLFTDVYEGDNVEWIPNLFGVEVNEWATWTSSLNVKLIVYYKMNETSGTALYDSLGKYNITSQITTAQLNQPGKIGTGYQAGGNSYANITTVGGINMTWNTWVNRTGSWSSQGHIFGDNINAVGAVTGGCWYAQAGTNVMDIWCNGNLACSYPGGGDFSFPQGQWTMFTVTRNDTGLCAYLNGALQSCQFDNSSTPCNLPEAIFGMDTQKIPNAVFDEYSIHNRSLSISEIQDLYNSGAGITWVGDSAGDLEYPTFSNEQNNNGSIFMPGNNNSFNITIIRTNGTAWIQFDNVNYSLTNSTSLFSRVLQNKSAGTYTYYYGAYGNGTSKNLNVTSAYYYTILKATPTATLLLNGTASNLNLNYPGQVNATASCTGTSYNIVRNATNVTTLNGTYQNLAVGTYNFTAYCIENQNYSSASNNLNVTINKGTSSIYAYVNNSRANIVISNGSQVYINGTLIIGVGNIQLYKNGTLINSGTSPKSNLTTFTTGIYPIIANYSGNENYTTSFETWNVTAGLSNVTTTSILSLSVTSPQVYGTNVNFSCSNTGTGTSQLYIDGIDYTSRNNLNTILGVGTHTINCSVNTFDYYLPSSNSTSFVITQAASDVAISFSPSSSVVVGTETTASCSASQTTPSLYRNLTLVSNPDVQTLALGSYEYTCFASATTNYSSGSTSSTLVIAAVAPAPTSGIINFTSTNLSQNFNFGVPYHFLTGAYMNITFTRNVPHTPPSSNYCYQESANVSVACGGLSTGSYTWATTGVINDGNYATDGSWGNESITNYSSSANEMNLTINYTIPQNVSLYNTKWQIKISGTTQLTTNITLYNNCSAVGNSLILRLNSKGGSNEPLKALCQNGTSFSEIGNYSLSEFTNAIYEEAIIWNTGAIYDLNISAQNRQLYNYNGGFNQTQNKSSNFYAALNPYLELCSFVGGYCYVPFNFTSSTVGILIYNTTLFSNTGFVENSQTYNATTYEATTESFSMNLSYDSYHFTTITPYFIYNGTTYLATTTGAGNNRIISRSVNTPDITSSSNISFLWMIMLTNSSGNNYYNSTTNYQSVLKGTSITAGTVCGAGLTPTFTFDFADETNLTELNATVSYYLQYGYSGNTTRYNIQGNLTNVANFSICINNSLPYYSVGYGEIDYKSSNSVTRKYYIFSNTRMTNVTVNTTLYTLDNSYATAYQETVEDNQLNLYKGYYTTILRWYPQEGNYKIVEMSKTDSKGQSVFYVQTPTTDYRIGVYKPDGTLIQLFSPVRFICQVSPCTYTVFVTAEEPDYTSFFGVQGNLSYNNNSRVFTYIWNDPSQLTSGMNMTVTQISTNPPTVICSSSGSGFTGVLVCDTTGYTGTIKAVVFRSASPSKYISSIIIETARGIRTIAGGRSMGLFFSLVLAALGALIGVFSPIAALILGLIALIPAWFLGAINYMVVVGFAILGGVIFHFIRKT